MICGSANNRRELVQDTGNAIRSNRRYGTSQTEARDQTPVNADAKGDRESMEEILREADIGHPAFVNDEPYVIPINYAYSKGRIIYHCALEGRKLDLIRANPKICFEVSSQEGHPAHYGETIVSVGEYI